MTPQVKTTTRKSPKTVNLFVAPLLQRIKKESAEEYAEMQDAFDLLGWAKLPDEIKIEIYEDVRFMVKELKGLFSSCDPYIQRRRDTVHFWVQSFLDKIATKEAAIKALKVKML
jgi:hypothetical protein